MICIRPACKTSIQVLVQCTLYLLGAVGRHIVQVAGHMLLAGKRDCTCYMANESGEVVRQKCESVECKKKDGLKLLLLLC